MPELNADTVLIVLPKWRTEAEGGHAGWVRPTGLLPASGVLRVLPQDWGAAQLRRRDGITRPVLRAAKPFSDPPAGHDIDRLQTLTGPGWTPILRAEGFGGGSCWPRPRPTGPTCWPTRTC